MMNFETRAKVAKLLQRTKAMDQEKGSWMQVWQDISFYVHPQRGDFNAQRARGDQTKVRYIYNTYPVILKEKLAAMVHGHLTNPGEKWFVLKLAGISENQSKAHKPAAEWLQMVEQYMYDNVFNAAESNFSSAIHEHYLDLVSFGTAITYVENRAGNPMFKTFHLQDCSIAEGENGMVDTVHRHLKKRAIDVWTEYKDAIISQTNDKGASFLESVNKNPAEMLKIVHIVEPNSVYDPTSQLAIKKPFISCFILKKDMIMLEESGYDNCPYIVSRWTKKSGEVYGRSPAMLSLPDIKMLNAISKTTIEAAQKAVDPPLTAVDDSVVDKVSTLPGGITYVRPGDEDSLKPLFQNTRPDIGMDFMLNIISTINDAFYQPRQDLSQGPQKTATEVMARQEISERLLGPVVSRHRYEFLSPMINRVFHIIGSSEAIGEAPKGLENYDIEYMSPVSRSSKLQMVQNVARVLELSQMLIAAKPETLDGIDGDKYMRFAMQAIDLREELILSDEEIKKIRDDRAAQQQAIMDAENRKTNAQAAKDEAQAQPGGQG